MRDIVENGDQIFEYTKNLDLQLFKQNKLVRDAVERCLTRISEAATKLGVFAEEQLPTHNWSNIRNLGNILRHEYERVDADIIWNIIFEWLRPLVLELRAFLARFPDDQNDV